MWVYLDRKVHDRQVRGEGMTTNHIATIQPSGDDLGLHGINLTNEFTALLKNRPCSSITNHAGPTPFYEIKDKERGVICIQVLESRQHNALAITSGTDPTHTRTYDRSLRISTTRKSTG
jgi:hypothetical protein